MKNFEQKYLYDYKRLHTKVSIGDVYTLLEGTQGIFLRNQEELETLKTSTNKVFDIRTLDSVTFGHNAPFVTGEFRFAYFYSTDKVDIPEVEVPMFVPTASYRKCLEKYAANLAKQDGPKKELAAVKETRAENMKKLSDEKYLKETYFKDYPDFAASNSLYTGVRWDFPSFTILNLEDFFENLNICEAHAFNAFKNSARFGMCKTLKAAEDLIKEFKKDWQAFTKAIKGLQDNCGIAKIKKLESDYEELRAQTEICKQEARIEYLKIKYGESRDLVASDHPVYLLDKNYQKVALVKVLKKEDSGLGYTVKDIETGKLKYHVPEKSFVYDLRDFEKDIERISEEVYHANESTSSNS